MTNQILSDLVHLLLFLFGQAIAESTPEYGKTAEASSYAFQAAPHLFASASLFLLPLMPFILMGENAEHLWVFF